MSQCFKKDNWGFSLVELLVSIGIVFVILTVVVLSQRTYTDAAGLSTLADELSLTISQAQAYGIAVKELSPGSSNFSASYGLTLSLLDTGSPTAYLLFADRNGNKFYDGDWSCPVGGASECLEKVLISRGNYIDSFCILRTQGADQCGTVERVDVSFNRPETASQLTFFNSGGNEFSLPNTKGVKITLKSPGGSARNIIVYTTGQISVQ